MIKREKNKEKKEL